jgi:hypothetical protein
MKIMSHMGRPVISISSQTMAEAHRSPLLARACRAPAPHARPDQRPAPSTTEPQTCPFDTSKWSPSPELRHPARIRWHSPPFRATARSKRACGKRHFACDSHVTNLEKPLGRAWRGVGEGWGACGRASPGGGPQCSRAPEAAAPPLDATLHAKGRAGVHQKGSCTWKPLCTAVDNAPGRQGTTLPVSSPSQGTPQERGHSAESSTAYITSCAGSATRLKRRGRVARGEAAHQTILPDTATHRSLAADPGAVLVEAPCPGRCPAGT